MDLVVVPPLCVSDKTSLAVLGVPWRTLRSFLDEHQIPSARMGRRRVVRLDVLFEALDKVSGAPHRPVWSPLAAVDKTPDEKPWSVENVIEAIRADAAARHARDARINAIRESLDPGLMVTLSDAARVATTTQRALRDAIREGKLRADGAKREVRRGDLAAWIEASPQRPRTGPGSRSSRQAVAIDGVVAHIAVPNLRPGASRNGDEP
jgi:hypothetical protein